MMQLNELKSSLVGEWTGTKRLYLPWLPEPEVSSPSRLSVQPVAQDSFLELRYDWSYEGEGQAGVLLLGYQDEQNAATAAWVDSWHMRSKIMSCLGEGRDGCVWLRGSYEVPPGPDWGWGIVIRFVSETGLKIVMHNISPEGEEVLAVQADYTRNV